VLTRIPFRRERGNAILECALVILPMLAIFLAIVDFSIAAFMRNTIQYAVRQGVRYAVTSQTMAGAGHDDSIKNVVQQFSMGFLAGAAGRSKIQVNYFNPRTLAAVTGAGSNAGGNIVEVSVNGLSWAWMAPVMRSATPLSISAASSDVMEASPNGIIPPR
jgi:Flp pilus assembly protein TadG